MKHKTEGLARPCSAWDLFLVTGGLQCGNCLATDVPPLENLCAAMASDGPCPLQAEVNGGLCWIHKAQKATEGKALQ